MDDEKKSVLVAALSVYADLLAKNKRDLDLEQGKGKGKATDLDVDLDAEVQNHIDICGELSDRVREAATDKDLVRAFTASIDLNAGNQLSYRDENDCDNINTTNDACISREMDNQTGDWRRSLDFDTTNRHSSSIKVQTHNPFITTLDDEPYENPFTGLPVIRETGYEAGPSHSKLTASPLQTKPLPASPPSTHVAKPRRRPSGPRSMDPLLISTSSSQGTSSIKDESATVQMFVDRPAPPTPNVHNKVSARKPVPTSFNVELAAKSRSLPPESTSSQPLVDFGSEPSAPNNPQQFQAQGDLDRNYSKKNKYTNYLAQIASKALKATGYGPSTSRPSSSRQSTTISNSLPTKLPTQTPEELPQYAVNYESTLALPSRASQETLPPAYDFLPDLNQRPSATSSLPGAGTSLWSSSSPSSSTLSSLSQQSVPTPKPGFQQDGIGNTKRASKISGSGANRTFTSTPPSLQEYNTSTSPPPDITSNHKRQSSRVPSTNPLPEPTTIPSLFAQPSRERFNSFGTNNPWTDEPAVIYHSSTHLGSNNTYVDSIAADEAFAKALQQEEERALQLERDFIFAYKLQNGTADEEDVDLEPFIFQESTKLAKPAVIAKRRKTRASMTSDPLVIMDIHEIQNDWSKAQDLDVSMERQNKADQDNFLAAKQLQEQYDREAQDDQAWETWKISNISTCTSCMEEHALDELVQGGCEHGYCNGCLQEGFKSALKSRSPFKCCKEALDIKDCLRLQDKFVMQYEEMVAELSTPNPIFCYNTKCAKFLPPRAITGDVGVCEKCSAKTCRHCKKKVHPGTFCAEDTETEAVKVMAKLKGWKTCPGCKHLIERWEGCLHMTCSRCQTSFCYRCSRLWKVCQSSCPDT